MSKLNDDFLEEFKRLDKVCREMYMSEKGITSYINDMENVSQFESLSITSWDTDLKQLKRLRHLRNQLSHEVGTLNKNMCTQSDIDWLRIFYKRIFNQSDPLALLHRKKKEKTQQTKAALQQRTSTYTKPKTPKHSSKFLRYLFIISFCAVAFILAVVIYKILLN